MSNFDIYLITSYVSVGFLIAIDAILPPMLFSLGIGAGSAWVMAGILAAFITGWTFLRAFFRRRRAAKGPMSTQVVISFVCYVIAVTIFAADAIVPDLRSGGPYELAVTFLTGAIMWTFVRRVESLLGEDPRTDWNPSRGRAARPRIWISRLERVGPIRRRRDGSPFLQATAQRP